MKKDMKMILLPLAALVIVGALFMFFKQKEQTPVTTEATTASNLYRDGNYTKGPANAKVTVLEYFDPECEGCAAFHPHLKKLLDEYPDNVQFVARYMLYHGNSNPAALALEGAGKQGKYWAMYDMLLERQNEWSHQDGSVTVIFERFAKELGLDIEEFNKSYDDMVFKASLAKDVADGQQLGVRGTPTFFVNGKMLQNLSVNDLKQAIDAELAR